MRCEDVRALISADLDAEATATESAAAAEHLAGCAECRAWRADAVRLDALFAVQPEVAPVEAASVGALAATGTVAAAAAAPPPVPPPRSPRRPLIVGGLLAFALLAGAAVGLLSGGDGDKGRPIVLPGTESPSPDTTVDPTTSESPTGSPTTSPSQTASPSATTTVSPTATGSPPTSPSPSQSPVSSPVATPSPQPVVATARAGVLDAELRIDDARPTGRIRGVLRVINNTRESVTYTSPECYELLILVDGAKAAPEGPACDSQTPEQHTLRPGESHDLVLNLAAAPGEHTVTGEFRGTDVEPSPDASGGKPTPGPTRVKSATCGPVVVRVR